MSDDVSIDEKRKAFAGLAYSHPHFRTLSEWALAALDDAERIEWLQSNALSRAFVDAARTHDPLTDLRATIDAARSGAE